MTDRVNQRGFFSCMRKNMPYYVDGNWERY